MKSSTKSVNSEHYTDDFYSLTRNYSRRSAEVIVPLLLELFPCHRVVDVGCGDGTWLKVFQEKGVKEILGIDGDYVDKDILEIPRENFVSFDLEKKLSLDQKFDLVVSLEVGEHLPESSADSLVDSLVNLGSVVVFSAAIPNQHGPGHVNEQWQDYWADKFYQRNYLAFDYVRKQVWNNDKVAYWYSQNTILYVEKNYLIANPLLQQKINKYQIHENSLVSLVHPTLYLIKQGLSDFWDSAETKLVENTTKNLEKSKYGKIKTLIRKFDSAFKNNF